MAMVVAVKTIQEYEITKQNSTASKGFFVVLKAKLRFYAGLTNTQ